VRVTSRSSAASWDSLASMRRRGQRPADGVWVTDRYDGRRAMEAHGLFAVLPPEEGQERLLVGLEAFLLADFSPRSVEIAQRMAAANPAFFSVWYRGRGVQVVIP
jgi:hypothetical protein